MASTASTAAPSNGRALSDAEKGSSGLSSENHQQDGLRSRKQQKGGEVTADDATAVNGSSRPPSTDGLNGDWGRPWSQRSSAYQFMPFRGMYYDVKGRVPYYANDWIEGFKPKNLYRVAAASIRMYFINLLPAIAYLLDMNRKTNGNYGINEVLLASALAAIVFPVFSVQPLTFVGVTGLINLFNYTNYDIVEPYGIDYLQFQCWMLIWAAVFHWLFAIFNISDYTRFITDMTSETFGFYVGIVYIQKGVELLVYEFDDSGTGGWLSVTIAILFALTVYFVQRAGGMSFGPFWLRKFLADYAFALSAVWWTGFANIPGYITNADIRHLPITRSFFPSTDRSWFIPFWNLPGKWIAASIPFGFLLMLLFYFDHNVSAVMAQARQYPVKKPAGFHWDFFLLGVTTLVSGFLGLPAPNGLVPQAPVNSEALSVMRRIDVGVDDKEGVVLAEDYEAWQKRRKEERTAVEHKMVRTRIIEQRVSYLAVGLLTLGTMTRPLLVVLGTMPRALFAGVFLVVGWGSIEGNGITHKTLYLLRDTKMTPRGHDLLQVRRRKVFLFVFIQWLFFAMTFAISETIAAIGFPVIIIALIPLRYYFGPKWFTPTELAILDAPTANSAAVMVSIGSDLERVTGEGKEVAEDTGIAGTLAKGSDGQPDMQAAYRARSRQEEEESHVNNVTNIRR